LKSYVPFLSLRYLWYHKVSSGLGVLGVTLGVGLVVVVVGVMDGFQARLKQSLVSNSTPVVVRPRYDVDADRLVEALTTRVPGVTAASPVVYTNSLAAAEGKRHSEGQPCRIVGLDPDRENRVSGLERKLHRGNKNEGPLSLLESADPEHPFRTPEGDRPADRRLRAEKQGVIVGKGLCALLGVYPGDRLRLFTLRAKEDGDAGGGDTVELFAESELFRVTGIFNSRDAEMDNVLLMDRRDALTFFKEGMRQSCDEVRLRLDDPERCDEVKAAVEGQADAIVAASLLPGGRVAAGRPLEAKTWKELFASILRAVENERGLLLVITSFCFVVVAFLIGSTQSMLVVEKTREIGVLRSLGASVAGTSSVFLANGLFIGVVGALAGWGVGVAITSNVQGIADFIRDTFGRDLFPQEIYRFDEIPIDVKGSFVLSICAGAVVFALLGAILPAVRAALLDPVESLHGE
jgi:lipoprotein-releasing system permease protein